MFRVYFWKAGELLSVTISFADDAFDALSMAVLNEPRWEESFPFGEHRGPGYSVGLTCGGARRAARSLAMICCRHSMPSLVKAVTPSSPMP